MSAPIPFQGTEDEVRANMVTHWWFTDFDGETRCENCDAKVWHAAAAYPCGVEPPRSDDPRYADLSLLRFAVAGSLTGGADDVAGS